MKLSRKMLIPIVVVSFLALTIFGVLSYYSLQREMEQLYFSQIDGAIESLHSEIELNEEITNLVQNRIDEKNIALARAFADFIEHGGEGAMEYDEMVRIAAVLGVAEVHVIDGDGFLVAGSEPMYYGMDFRSTEQTSDFIALLDGPGLELAQEPRENGRGYWRQYTGVSRTDAPGFVQVGIDYDVATEISNIMDIATQAANIEVGRTGYAVVVEDSIIVAHQDAERIGENLSELDWYQDIVAIGPDGNGWVEVRGELYLTGWQTYNGITVFALIPEAEYYEPLNSIRVTSAALILVSSVLLAAVLFWLIKREVLTPISHIAGVMRKISKGDFNARLNGKYSGEFADLKKDINHTVSLLRLRQDGILNNYPGIVWSCEKDFNCTLFAGRGMADIGIEPSQFLGRNIVEVHRTEDYGNPQIAEMMIRTFAEHEPQRLNANRNGRYLTMTTDLLYNESGEVQGLVGVCVDITDVQLMQIELEKAIEDAERANKAKSEFLSRMSHEIRTPMNAIIGMNTIAQKTEDITKINYCLAKIKVASDQLLSLINDILDMSKIEANKFELNNTEFDFEQMLQTVCNVIDDRISEKKQEFVIDFHDVYSRNMVADSLRLSQVMLNLLSNAVKFTPEGGKVTLKIRHKPIDEDVGQFFFEVTDTGIGISDEHQQRLFTSFEQGDGSITRRYGGTGLGLSICKTIVKMMGGDISLESSAGGGSTFKFYVNVRWGNEKGTEDNLKHIPLRGTRILVIDDNHDVLDYFQNILEGYSIHCATAQDGVTGVKRVQQARDEDNDYDLVFVDWMMPGMNGIETARAIKSIVSEHTIVIMISVADWSEIQAEAAEIGVDKYLAKPVLPAVLVRSIVQWLNTADADALLPEEDAWVDWHGKRMLLVEDIDINQEIIVSMLADTGIKVDCAADGQQGLNAFLENPEKYDIILMDLQMPVLDGLEATRRIRAANVPHAKTIPIIAMTANAFKTDVEKCLNAGMNGHIAKPVSLDDMIEKIKAALPK